MADQTTSVNLNQREWAFVESYFESGAKRASAVAAGYSERTAHAQATRLLKKVKIQAALDAKRAEAERSTTVSRERVLEELARCAFANMDDFMRAGPDGDPYLDFSTLKRAQKAALVEVTVDDYTEGRGEDARDVRRIKFKLANKLSALDQIVKMQGYGETENPATNEVAGGLQALATAICTYAGSMPVMTAGDDDDDG